MRLRHAIVPANYVAQFQKHRRTSLPVLLKESQTKVMNLNKPLAILSRIQIQSAVAIRSGCTRMRLASTLSLLMLAGVFLAQTVSAATLTTDQADYAPFTYVQVTGAGFAGSEVVQLRLETLNADGITWSMVESNADWPNPWTVAADANGNITDQWYVYSEDFIGVTLRLTATGQTSGSIAIPRLPML